MPVKFSQKEFDAMFGPALDPCKKKESFPHYKPKKKAKKNTSPYEDVEQAKVVQYCRWNNIRFFAVPNANTLSFLDRNLATRIMTKLKAQGLSNGALDLVFPIVTKKYPGLYIELKRLFGGTVSEEQKEWLEYLIAQGYRAVVCKGADAAIEEIKKYLSL